MNTLFTLPRNPLQPELLAPLKGPFPARSLFFAPMEGITDGPYRLAILKHFPEWDFVCTDFLRICASSIYPEKFILEHLGELTYHEESYRKKTIYQVLTSPGAHTKETVTKIKEKGISWIDLNLGCPSRTVNSSKGGAYLLSDLTALKEIIKTIRENFPGTFTVKMRVGYRDDSCFEETLRILEGEGVEAITVHARTRDELYKGRANWSYIRRAVQVCQIPIVGNGDIWQISDIDEIYKETGCHSLMLARGAMKTPWLAKLYKENLHHPLDKSAELHYRTTLIPFYFNTLESEYRIDGYPDMAILKRFKALSRYLFEDYPEGEKIKSQFLRAATLDHFKELFLTLL